MGLLIYFCISLHVCDKKNPGDNLDVILPWTIWNDVFLDGSISYDINSVLQILRATMKMSVYYFIPFSLLNRMCTFSNGFYTCKCIS